MSDLTPINTFPSMESIIPGEVVIDLGIITPE
jgi:hypothetical protein